MKIIQIQVLAASLVLLAGCQTGTHSQATRQPEALSHDHELRQASVEWDGLFNSGETTKLAALYAEDAISMPPNAPTVRGRQALQADFKSFLDTNTARHETTVDGIVREGNLAIEHARYRLTYKPRSGVGTEVVETGRHLECRKKVNGKWLIVLEIWNSDTPPAK
jgi:ketosteroid isomerase-like protein